MCDLVQSLSKMIDWRVWDSPVREQAGEALDDVAAYDLVWLALIFMPEKIVDLPVREQAGEHARGRRYSIHL